MTTTSELARLLMMQGTRLPDAGLGPVTNTTRAGLPNPMLTATQDAPRPADYMAPVAETLSIPMGAYGAGQLVGGGINAMRDADYASGAGQIALGMAGMLPMSPKGGKGIRAFHGSPHDFDKFDMSKIGSGEGAQAYGHGLYFAEREGVARSYRDTLSKQKAADLEKYNISLDGKPWKPSDDIDNLIASEITRFARLNMPIETLQHSLTNRWAKGDGDQFMQAAQRVSNLRDQGAAFGYDPGHMYEVRINADPNDFLDWFQPVQGNVMDRVAPLGVEPGAKGLDALQQVAATLAREGKLKPGKDLSAQVSETLKDAGVPGIRYLDQMSRGEGKGSSNYVVFDDALIEIMRKYGLLGPVAGTGMAGLLMGGQDEGMY